MLVRLDRLALTTEQLEQPIPALSERQFVVAKVKRSPEEARLERELFWYREELLRRVKLSWNEVRLLAPLSRAIEPPRDITSCRPA